MLQDIQEAYNNPDKRIIEARAYHAKLMLHVHGVGLSSALELINNYENEQQKKARDKFAISNKFVSDRLLRPTDNVFSAKGGYRKYHFKANQEKLEQEFVGKLVDVYSGYSLSQYIHRIWFDKHIVDPNGLIFLEVSEDGREIYPTYKSINSIRNYKQDGIKVEWVIFEPDTTIFDEERPSQVKEELFWTVDEKAYYRCKADKKDQEVTIIGTIQHGFGQVPATLCSDIEDPVTGYKLSPIDAQIELLEKFMVDTSVLNIVDFAHNYPKAWALTDDCGKCNGTGVVANGTRDREGNIDNTCPACGGSGLPKMNDATDITWIKAPKSTEEHLITTPMGYVTLPSEGLRLKIESIDRSWNLIMFSHWGTSIEFGSTDGNQYATAMGRFLDTQPVNNRLYRYTESVQLIHNSLADLYGKFYYPETFNRSEVIYGKRYLIETPDQLKKSYTDISNLTENTILLDDVFERYLESEYRDNDKMFAYQKKLLALDPLAHFKLSELKEIANQSDIDKKLYITEYKHSRDIEFVLVTPIDKLRKDYELFIKERKNG